METRCLRRKPRILIVEDETITGFDVRRSLVRLGYEVVGIAPDGPSALDLLERYRADLLLADIGLEGEMDGVEVAGQARERYGIPVVFLTAYSDVDTMRRARITEPFGYLVKPFAEQELHATIEIALQQNGLRKAQEQELTANARNLQRTREELTAATERLFRIQEQEREEISRDLHDDIGQRLAVLQMSVESLWTHLPATVRESNCSERDKIINLIGGLAEDLRDLSHRLHPSVLDHLGLAAALGELAEAFQESSRLPTRFSAREVPGELDPKISLAAYRIVQEALHNVRKHAGREATVTIALVGSATGLYLTIRDTGPGIDPQRLKSVNGLGLISMAQRAEMVGGKLTIDSHPGQGAIINVTIPFHAGAADKKSSDFDGGSGPSRSDGTSYTSGAHKPDERAQGARRKGSEDVKGER